MNVRNKKCEFENLESDVNMCDNVKCSRLRNVKNKSAVVRFVVTTMADFSHKQQVNS